MLQCIDEKDIVRRLRRIEGQVRGLVRMVEEDKPCEDILIQIGSVKAALHKVGQYVLEGHLHHCVLDGIRQGNGDEVLDRLGDAAALESTSQFANRVKCALLGWYALRDAIAKSGYDISAASGTTEQGEPR
mgnify:CR=1 FL=1